MQPGSNALAYFVMPPVTEKISLITIVSSTTYSYVWDYHGAWHWSSMATLRCLPGYEIPLRYENVRNVFVVPRAQCYETLAVSGWILTLDLRITSQVLYQLGPKVEKITFVIYECSE